LPHLGEGKLTERLDGVRPASLRVPPARLEAAFAEMETELRSRTQGRATYTMQFDSYKEVPQSIQEDVVATVRGEPVGS
jgi:histidinol dehydrogenase